MAPTQISSMPTEPQKNANITIASMGPCMRMAKAAMETKMTSAVVQKTITLPMRMSQESENCIERRLTCETSETGVGLLQSHQDETGLERAPRPEFAEHPGAGY